MKRNIICLIILLACIGGFTYLTDYHLVLGNKWPIGFAVEIFTQILITGLILSFFWHTLGAVRNTNSKKSGIIGGIWGVFGFLVVGCPLCGFSLAGFFGLTWVLISLPFHGEEFKILAIILLIIANVLVRKKPKHCKIPKST